MCEWARAGVQDIAHSLSILLPRNHLCCENVYCRLDDLEAVLWRFEQFMVRYEYEYDTNCNTLAKLISAAPQREKVLLRKQPYSCKCILMDFVMVVAAIASDAQIEALKECLSRKIGFDQVERWSRLLDQTVGALHPTSRAKPSSSYLYIKENVGGKEYTGVWAGPRASRDLLNNAIELANVLRPKSCIRRLILKWLGNKSIRLESHSRQFERVFVMCAFMRLSHLLHHLSVSVIFDGNDPLSTFFWSPSKQDDHSELQHFSSFRTYEWGHLQFIAKASANQYLTRIFCFFLLIHHPPIANLQQPLDLENIIKQLPHQSA